MSVITISKMEYKALRDLKTLIERNFLLPPVRSRKSIVKSFTASGLYNKAFLRDLERGLKNSRYFGA